MSAYELARLVIRMRAAQRDYFRRRSETALAKAKEYEKRVDLECAKVISQPSLFPDLPGGRPPAEA